MLIKIHVFPCVKEEGVVKIKENAFNVSVRPKPENGAANARAIELLALYFAVPPGRVRLIKGAHQANKIFEIKE